MTKKELIDIFFKSSIVVAVIIFIFMYYSNYQINRYKFNNNDNGHYAFDSCTGKLYEYAFKKDSATGETKGRWAVYTPFKSVEIKDVQIEFIKDKKPIQ